MQQAIANLVANALKFSRDGSRVAVTVEREGARARVIVRDEGCGISQAFLPHLFMPYEQEDSTLTRAHGGLGLGLAIVQQIVKLHDGEVRADSAGEGRGATFTIELPSIVAIPEPRDAGLPLAAEPRGVQGLRVLVLDDDAPLRAALVATLAHRGARVVEAATPAEALAALARVRFDVFLCDLAMPEMDGYALIRRLRSRSAAEGGDTPAVALSGQARDQDRERAIASGFQDHVTKPVAGAVLARVLVRVVADNASTETVQWGR